MEQQDPRAPGDRGQGRKTISKSGETMKNRIVRTTDSEWADCELVAGEAGRSAWIRAQIAKAAKSLKRKASLDPKPAEIPPPAKKR